MMKVEGQLEQECGRGMFGRLRVGFWVGVVVAIGKTGNGRWWVFCMNLV